MRTSKMARLTARLLKRLLALGRAHGREPVSLRRLQQPTVVCNEGLELLSDLQGAGDMERIEGPHATRYESAGSLHQSATERDSINAMKGPPCGTNQLGISSKSCTQDLRDGKLARHAIRSPPQISAECRGFGFSKRRVSRARKNRRRPRISVPRHEALPGWTRVEACFSAV
jgi:hypothetical protein